MRKTWKEVGLGLLNLLVVVGVVVATQPLLRRYLGAGGAAVLALLCLGRTSRPPNGLSGVCLRNWPLIVPCPISPQEFSSVLRSFPQ